MTTNFPHRMLVVHNLPGAGDRARIIEPKPFRKFAFGSLLAYADDVYKRLLGGRALASESLALPGDVPVYEQAELEHVEVGERYDSVMCHLVLDHGGVVADGFFGALRERFLKPDGLLLNPVKSITKTDVARASRFALETDSAPCVIKKNNNYNKPETVFELRTQAELEAWRERNPPEERSQYVTHKLVQYFGMEASQMYQLERWVILFDDLTINYRNSDEFYVKTATSLSYHVRDERRMKRDLTRLAETGLDWKGRSIDCAYDHDPEAWDARYAVLQGFREAFHFDYAELDVIQPAKNEFVVIDVNQTPGPSYKNVHWRELAVRLLADRLGLKRAAPSSVSPRAAPDASVAPVAAPAPRAGARTNICLCMIVKNETAVLPRLFRSLKDYIDYYVIVDTGSTDETIALIRREMSGYGIPGEVHEREWVNFGVNRQQALDLAVAADKADWLLFIDADEELGVSDPKFYEKLEPGVSYDLEKHHGDLRYSVPHLVNVKASRFRWEGPVHNFLVTLEGPKQRVLRKDVWIVYHHAQGAKSHKVTQEEKFLRDAKLLEDELARNPSDARSQFYLGQSYRDAGHLEKALAAYKKRAAMENGWDEERFMAQLEAGRIAVRLEAAEALCLGELLGAYNLRPTRAEPLYELARYFRLRKNYPMAALFAKAGVKTPLPNDRLFVARSHYTWQLLDELSIAAYWLGDHASAVEAGEALLERVQGGVAVPQADLRRIEENLAHARSKLKG